MKLTTIPRIKKINLSQKRFERRRRLYASKRSWRLDGGPLNRAWLVQSWNPSIQHSRLEWLLRRRE